MREARPTRSSTESRGRRRQGVNICRALRRRSTTVNWTGSFTPPATLAHWQQHFGLKDYSEEALAPWFSLMEQRLHVSPWAAAPNENNDLLRRGAAKLGVSKAVIPRNVNGCWNLGYCGMGCPTNAKQSMLVTTIPSALSHGATICSACVPATVLSGDQVTASNAAPWMQPASIRRRAACCCGRNIQYSPAASSAAALLRRRRARSLGPTRRRSFLHPTVISSTMDSVVAGHAGAPQSLYSDHFLDNCRSTARSVTSSKRRRCIGAVHHHAAGLRRGPCRLMQQFNHAHVLLALLRDG